MADWGFFWSEKDYQKISSNIPAIILPHIFTPSAFAFNWDMVFWSWFAFFFLLFLSTLNFLSQDLPQMKIKVQNLFIQCSWLMYRKCTWLMWLSVLWMNVLTEVLMPLPPHFLSCRKYTKSSASEKVTVMIAFVYFSCLSFCGKYPWSRTYLLSYFLILDVTTESFWCYKLVFLAFNKLVLALCFCFYTLSRF